MSAKKILGGVLLIAAIAIPIIGPAVLGISMIAAGVISAGLAIAANVLLGPATPKMPGSLRDGGRDRLHASLDVSAPRKILFGETAGATDVRYQTFTGTDQEFLHQIVCVASHKVDAIYEIWLDNELAWSTAGGVTSTFTGFLEVATRTEGTSGNGIAIDSEWTTTATLTGCAYFHVRYKLISDNADETGNESPFASGVTSRMTVRCRGAFIYDPRLDSTVTGGSGSHRPDNQATWAWNANASRNPALQLLWYLLGWKINNKLACGMGLPPSRLDLPSFITAANACDESVTKNGGGTEPRYRSDGVLSEADDRAAVVEALCVTMNAVMRDSGGKLSLYVLHNDLASPVADFNENDILGTLEWSQTPDISSTFNITRGRRIDPSDEALYQPVDYPEVKLTSPDGIDRIDTLELPLVQSNGQAQRLAKQRLQRGQYQGRASLIGKPKWWQASIGDVIRLSHSAFGWTNKLFRVAGQRISRTGETETVLVEEHAAIYAWDNNEAPPVTAGVPTIYNANNHPLIIRSIENLARRAGNMLRDLLFRMWTLTPGVIRVRANSDGGYAKGNEFWYIELSPSTTDERSALSPLVRITAGQRYFFRAFAQRGTTLGSGSRLNLGGDWIGSDRTTVIAAAAEGEQQTPSNLTAGALPKEVNWDDIAPANAFYFRQKIYTPALANSSGTFRVESPWVGLAEPSADISRWIDGPSQSTVFKYSHTGTAESGEFSRDFLFFFMRQLGQVLTGLTWRYVVKTGTINGFSPSATERTMSGTGTGTLTVSSLGTDTASIEVRAKILGIVVATKVVSFSRQYATSPTSGGGGGGGGGGSTLVSKTSGFTSFNSTTFTDVTGSLNGTTPSGVTSVQINVLLTAQPGATGGAGFWTVEMKAQRNISGTWTDVGSARTSNSAFEIGEGPTLSATFDFSQTNSSLSGSTAYSWRVVARLQSGTKNHNVTGTVSVTA